MHLNSFIFEEDTGLFLPGSKPEFSYSDGIETEDYLLNAVTTARNKGTMSQELKSWIKDWPTRYHLSPSRSNLLRPFSFLDKSMDVLELGAGCGALTCYLGEKCGSVDAVEGSYIRAKIARERCSDLENVKVYVDNFFNMSFDKKYDVVTLIGVLEYAPLFCPTKFKNSEEACLELLRLANNAVKDDGVIILAIENKLGLKYWAGCKEDHTGKVSEGLHGYPGTSCQHAGPVTFSKKELENMIHRCGLPEIDFYYPFPDYKLPNTILKEEADYSPADLFLYNWVTTPFEDYTGAREYKFHESLALRNITKAGLFGEFANSFLILAGKGKQHTGRRWVAKRFATERKPRYATVTTLYTEPELTIVKELLNGTQQADHYKGPIFLKQLHSKWQPGELLSFDFYEAILSDADPMGHTDKLLLSYHNKLLDAFGVGKKDEEGYPLLRGDSIDYVPWNILVHKGQWSYIDDEWEYQGLLPIDYVIFRFLYHFIYLQNEYMKTSNLLDTNTNNFILRAIQQIYSQYDLPRNETNQHREEQFQEIVYTSTIDGRLARLILENQRLEVLLNENKEEVEKLLLENQRLEILLNENKEEVEKLLLENQRLEILLKEEVEKLIIEKQKREEVLLQKEEAISNLTGQLDSKLNLEHRLSLFQNQLLLMENSLGWRIIKKYRTAMDRLFPLNSGRRKLYELAQKSVKTILVDGPFALIRKVAGRTQKKQKNIVRETLLTRQLPQHAAIIVNKEVAIMDVAVSVVIPTKNAGDSFRYLLSMLRNQKGIRHIEIILVDSGSTDNTLEIARKFDARIIEIKPEQFSHSYARNLGAEAASGDYILFTVQDALPPSDLWLYELYDAIKNNDVVAVSCVEAPLDDADLFYRVISWNHYRFLDVLDGDRILSKPSSQDHIELRKNGQLSDIACLISREIFLNYKYDGDYAEDLELGIKLTRDGFKLALLSSTKVLHSHNRPAYYHLKRGYVDNLFLTRIFPDYSPGLTSVDKLLPDILFTYSALNSLVYKELCSLVLPCRIRGIASIVTRALQSSLKERYPSKIEIAGNQYIDNSFALFLERLSKSYQFNESKMAYDGTLVHGVINYAGLIFEYMENTYDLIDTEICEDFKLALWKAYAITCGAQLACCYLCDSGDKREIIEEIDRELRGGV